MSGFSEILLTALAAVTLENCIFTSAIGTSTLIECAREPKHLLSFGMFITEFSVLSSLLAYFAEGWLKSDIAKLFLPSVYVVCLGLVYVLTLLFIWFVARKWFKALKKYVHLSAFNCAVLGCLFNNGLSGETLGPRLLYAAGIGLGFILATYLLAINYKKLSGPEVPASFRGFPASVLYIGVFAMIIYGLKL